MTEELEKTVGDINVAEKLNSILDWVEQTAKTAEAFAIEQTPLYIQELLAWNFWTSLIWFSIGFLPMIGQGVLLKFIVGEYKIFLEKGNSEDTAFCCVFGTITSLLFLLFIPLCFFLNNLDWLQITVAPRVWLVEYVASKL